MVSRLFISLLLTAVICFDGYATTTTYDYANRTQGTNIWAYQYDGGTTEQLTVSEYNNIEVNDGVFQVNSTYVNFQTPTHYFVYKIDQSESLVTTLNIFWNGKNANGHPGSYNGTSLYIYNYSTSSYQLIHNSFGTGEITENWNITSNLSSYIGGTGNNEVVIAAQTYDTTKSGRSNYIFTDYASITVTSIDPPHHYEILHEAAGKTCASESVTIKACTDAACTSTVNYATSLNFKVDGVTQSSPSFTGETTFNFNHSMAEIVTLSVDGFSLTADNAVTCDDGAGGVSCSMTFDSIGCLDHYEIEHDGTGSACAAETVTIKACTDASCSSLYTTATSIDFKKDGVTQSSPTFTGSTTVSFNHTSAATVALSLANPSIAALNADSCDNTSGGTSCNMDFVTIGCIDHYEVAHDGTGSTCAADSVTVKACANGDCSVLSTLATSIDFQKDGVTQSSPSFTGSTTVNFSHNVAENVSLGLVNPSIVATNTASCDDGAGGNSCVETFSSAGCSILFAQWTFDEGTGQNAADNSGNGHTGTIGTSASIEAADPSWQCEQSGFTLDFNSTESDVVTVPAFTPPSETVIAFWLRVPDTPSLTQRPMGSGNGWEVRHATDGRLYFDINHSGSVDVTGTTSVIPANTWTHVAAIFSASADTWKIYVNGSLDNSGSATQTAQTSATFTLGQSSWQPTEPWSGQLDDVRIYSGTLTAAEITALAATPPENCAELIANYRFDECSYEGTNGEVIDQLSTYSANSFSSVDTIEMGQIERAIDLNQYSHHVETSIPLPASFSVSTWFKKPTSTSDSPYFVLGAMATGGDLMYIDRTNSWRWGVYNQVDGSVDGSYSFSSLDTNWHHLTLVYQNSQTNLYIDGVLVDTINLVPSGTLKYIGTSFDSVNTTDAQGFRAPIDEFMVYQGALTSSEVTTIYNNQLAQNNYDGSTRDPVVCTIPIHHYQIEHDGNGLTCAAEPITIKACTNSDCSTLSTDATSLYLQGDGANLVSPSFTGSTTVNINYTDISVDDTLTLSIANPSVAPTNTTVCNDGSGSSCDIAFSEAGFILDINSGNDVASCALTNLIIKAVKLSDTGVGCAPAFTGSQSIDFVFDHIIPNTTNASATVPVLVSASMAAAGNTDNRNVTFDGNGEVTLPLQYDDAGRISITVREDVSSGVSSATIIKDFYPSKLVVSTVLNSADHTGTDTQIAGDNFQIDVAAQCADGTATPNYQPQNADRLRFSLQQQAPTVALGYLTTASSSTVVGATNNTTTNWTNVNESTLSFNVNYSEVGIINIAAIDSDYLGTGIDTMIGPVSYTTVGRFIPDHFTLTSSSVSNYLLNSTYMNQPNISLDYQIEAQNQNGIKTQNYTGDYAKSIVSLVAENSNDGNDLASRLSGFNGVWSEGEYTDDDNLGSFTRLTNAVDGPFDDLLFGIQLVDSDGRELEALDMNADESTDCTVLPDCNAKTLLAMPSQIRFGRLHLSNSYGPETSPLNIPMALQYWDGTDFVTNSIDSMTPFDFVNMTKNEVDIAPSVTSLSGDGSFVSGLTRDVLLAAPSPTARGSVALSYDLDLSAMPWLQYDWDNADDSFDGPYDDNPTATATFGLFRGNDRIIYWREVNK